MKNTSHNQSVTNQKLSDPSQMPYKVYKFRVMGMGLGGIAIAAVLFENQVSKFYWLWLFLSCFVWPHFAFQTANRNSQPFLAERRNLLFDSFIAGTWAALMWFNLLPAVLLLAISTADKSNSGIKNLWLYSQPVMLLGAVLGMVLTGFKFQPETSMAVILACMPVMIVHIFFVSLGTNKLIRKVQKQNILFKELSQKDTLTQLYNRRHWQHQVDLLLQKKDPHSSLTLILIDVDHFKQLNDINGHSIGDEVLLAIGDVISDVLPEHAIAGRFGGDEFAIVLQKNLLEAKQIASLIRQQVADLTIHNIAELNCAVSIGLSETNPHERDFRSWFDRADKNLYRAKNAGRNQIH